MRVDGRGNIQRLSVPEVGGWPTSLVGNKEEKSLEPMFCLLNNKKLMLHECDKA